MTRATPVHFCFFTVCQSFFHQSGEHPLFPAVIFRLAGSNFTTPVIRKAETLQLFAHLTDIGVCPLCRRKLALNRSIFRRQTKSIPANGMQHIETLHFFEARNSITQTVITYMSHMQITRRIGKHFQTVVMWPLLMSIFSSFINTGVLPYCLPFLFYLSCIVMIGHRSHP